MRAKKHSHTHRILKRMSEREKLLLTLLYLMREQIDCLRSVLSEFEGDKSHFVQMNRANILEHATETLEYKV